MKVFVFCLLSVSVQSLHSGGLRPVRKETNKDARFLPKKSTLSEYDLVLATPDEPAPLPVRDALSVHGGSHDLATRLAMIPMKGILSIFGGFLVQMAMGSMESWPCIMVYAPESLRSEWLMSACLISYMVTIPVLAKVTIKLGPRLSTIVGSQLVGLAFFLSSFVINCGPGPFLFLFSGLFGSGMAMAYASCLPCAWGWFPNRKGLVNGIILSGIGGGSILGNLIASSIANPMKLSPLSSEFPPSVIMRFPTVLRSIGAFFAITAGFGGWIMTHAPPCHPPKTSITVEVTKSGRGADAGSTQLQAAMRSPQFIILCILACFNAAGCYSIFNIYRTFGQKMGVLTTNGAGILLGSIAAAANGLSRPVWGKIIDLLGTGRSFSCLSIMNAAVLFGYIPIALSKSFALFTIATATSFACLGGIWTCLSTASSEEFGIVGSQAFSLLFIAVSAGSTIPLLLARCLGLQVILVSMAVLSLVAVGVAENYPTKNRKITVDSDECYVEG